MNTREKVSVLIPCRNEAEHLKRCVSSIIASSYPKSLIEIIIIDGESSDTTPEIIKSLTSKYPNVKAILNPLKIFPAAINRGIDASEGDIIIIIGAHAIYHKEYIEKCVQYLRIYDAQNVGGVLTTKAKTNSFMSKLIVQVLSSPFGVGNATFRTGSDDIQYVDTVFGGCYKKEIFKELGFFDERLVSSSDIEFNARLRRAGGRILLAPDIEAVYYTRSKFFDFIKNNIRNGFWAIYPLGIVENMPSSVRHFIPLLFILSLVGSLLFSVYIHESIYIFYGILTIYFIASLMYTVKYIQKGIVYIFLPFVYFLLHLSYGLGSLSAIFFILKKKNFYRVLFNSE